MSASQLNLAQDELIQRRNESRERSRCLDIDCPYFDADSIPNHAIALDLFSDEDMAHIEDCHPSC